MNELWPYNIFRTSFPHLQSDWTTLKSFQWKCEINFFTKQWDSPIVFILQSMAMISHILWLAVRVSFFPVRCLKTGFCFTCNWVSCAVIHSQKAPASIDWTAHINNLVTTHHLTILHTSAKFAVSFIILNNPLHPEKFIFLDKNNHVEGGGEDNGGISVILSILKIIFKK